MINKLVSEVKTRGADFVKIVDVSMLSKNENRGYNAALLMGIALSPVYIESLLNEENVDSTEFTETENRVDKLGEWAADFIIEKGYEAYAQSERNLVLHGLFDVTTKTSPLPHKTIAILAGLGWIGKNNLLVTEEYGSAVCLSTVLTNAPLPTRNKTIITSRCGKCTVCENVCQTKAIHGSTWNIGVHRDHMVDIHHCTCCLKCLAICPWTQNYMKNGSAIK